jgi:hypothetical protein
MALVALVVLVGFIAIVQALGGGTLLASIASLFASGGRGAVALAQLAYYRLIIPAFQRIGWVVVGVLVVGVVGAWLLYVFGSSTIPIWVPAIAMVVAGVPAYWIWSNNRRGANLSVFTALSAAFLGLLALGLWFFVAAHLAVGSAVSVPANTAPLMDARMLAILGVIFILMARELLFVTLDLVAHMAKLGVDFAEGSSNLVVSVAKTLLTAGLKGLAGVDINLANQELFKPAVKRAKTRINGALLPVLALGVLAPFPSVLGLTMLAGTFVYLAYENAENTGIDTLTWRQRAARTLVYLGYVVLAVLALVVFFPPLQAQFDGLLLAVGSLIGGILQTAIDAIYWVLGIKGHKFTGFPWYAALGGLLFTAFVAWAIWPNEDHEGAARRVRQGLAAPFIVMMFWALGSLTLTIFTWNTADTVGIDHGVSLSKMKEPSAVLVSGPAVQLTYPEIPRASGGYVYQRRVITDRTWTSLGTVADGVVHFNDTTVVPGTTYAYRVAATFPTGQDEFSREVLVTIPSAGGGTGGSGGGGSGGSGGGSGTRTACSGPNCGNPGLDAMCRRYPSACQR